MNEQQQPRQNNTCLDVGQIIAWHDGALPPPEADEVMAHLAVCTRCAAEERALLSDRQQVLGLLTTLDPPPTAHAGPAVALARFQQRLHAQHTGTFLHDSNWTIHPGTFRLSSSEREGTTLTPARPSIRRHRPGAVAQTLVAAIFVAALLGTTLLLLRARAPSTSATLQFVGSAAQAYGRFEATNGIMFGFDAQHTHFNPFEQMLNPTTVGGLTKKWAYDMGSSVIASPTVAGGVVYVGSEDHTLYALDAATGAKKWMSPIRMSTDPVLAGGLLYFGSFDGILYALDATTGAKKWAYRDRGTIDSSPAVADGMVYFGSGDGPLYAFHLPGT